MAKATWETGQACLCKDDIKMNLKEAEHEGENWVRYAQDTVPYDTAWVATGLVDGVAYLIHTEDCFL